MWNNDILLFIVLFVLSVVLIDETIKAFFTEFIIFIFSIMNWAEYMSSNTISTEWDFVMGGYLFVINAFVAFALMVLWLIDRRKGAIV